ncbi:MAG: amidohydrolase family protein [Flavobacteriales bacterium]|nr:amidohydrolase family protein [Flavobacteriales bacterium]
MVQRILKTDILYTSAGRPIENGMLAIDEHDRIVSVGTSLREEGVAIEYFKGALCPGFVNTHCHLELSHLVGQVTKETGLNGFIQELQKLRAAKEIEIQEAIKEADRKMSSSGIVAVGDISNGNSTFETKQQSSIQYHTFVELFGFDKSQADSILERGKQLKTQYANHQLAASIIPHSPYSVSRELFELISQQQNNTPLSIHNQETEAENEMYQTGKGKMIEMLQSFGLDTSTFEVRGKTSLLSYLSLLPSDSPLLLVHNTFTSKEDIEVAESIHNQLFWCFCPKANLYIENRLPNILQFIEAGVKCTLGTDSLASNDSLSIWEEIATIQEHYPDIVLETLLEWATINGAQFLGIEKDYGSFEVGKRAAVNWINGGGLTPLVLK